VKKEYWYDTKGTEEAAKINSITPTNLVNKTFSNFRCAMILQHTNCKTRQNQTGKPKGGKNQK